MLIQTFLSNPTIERFNIRIICRFSRPTEIKSHMIEVSPPVQTPRNKLRAIIRPDMFGWTVFNEELAQGVQHVAGVEFTFNTDGETLARELIDYAEHAEDSTIMCSVLDEVIGPNMAFIGRSETDA